MVLVILFTKVNVTFKSGRKYTTSFLGVPAADFVPTGKTKIKTKHIVVLDHGKDQLIHEKEYLDFIITESQNGRGGDIIAKRLKDLLVCPESVNAKDCENAAIAILNLARGEINWNCKGLCVEKILSDCTQKKREFVIRKEEMKAEQRYLGRMIKDDIELQEPEEDLGSYSMFIQFLYNNPYNRDIVLERLSLDLSFQKKKRTLQRICPSMNMNPEWL